MDFNLAEPRASVNGEQVAALTVRAKLNGVPWRTALLHGSFEAQVQAQAGYRETQLWTVFEGNLDDAGESVLIDGSARARSLPQLRQQVGPQGFTDVDLPTLLRWIAGKVGLQVQIKATGYAVRHYALTQAPAHRALTEALTAWRKDDVLLELNDGTLYIGPEAQSPHALAGVQATLVRGGNLIDLQVRGAGSYTVKVPLMPWLRVSHRVEISHLLYAGRARIVDCEHHIDAGRSGTLLEVVAA